MAVPFYYALFHSGMPAPNLPDLPSRPPVGAAMLCSSRLRSIPFRLAPSYRLTAANPCRSILLCFIPARTALLCYQPTLHRSRSIWFIYYNQKNMHSTSAPSATRDNQLSSLLMRWETFPNRISHSSRYSNIHLSYTTAQHWLSFRSARRLQDCCTRYRSRFRRYPPTIRPL